jgi:hypothetical protein
MAMAMTMAMYKPIKGQEEEDNGNRNKSLKSNDEDGVGGDHTIVDDSKTFILPTHSKQQHHQQRMKQQQQQQRLVSLDVFRGLTVAVMFPFTNSSFFLFVFCSGVNSSYGKLIPCCSCITAIASGIHLVLLCFRSVLVVGYKSHIVLILLSGQSDHYFHTIDDLLSLLL